MSKTETGKYHVLRFDGSHYNYECPTGLMASGPWDRRPKACDSVGCRRDLIEQSTLDAAIEAARASDAEQLIELRKALELAIAHIDPEADPDHRTAREMTNILRKALNPSHSQAKETR